MHDRPTTIGVSLEARPSGAVAKGLGDAADTPRPGAAARPPGARGTLPTPTEVFNTVLPREAFGDRDDVEDATMSLAGGALDDEPSMVKPRPAEVKGLRELSSVHVWVASGPDGARLFPRSDARPAGAIEAVLVTDDGAALRALLEDA